MEARLKEAIRKYVRERNIQKSLDEMSVTGNVAGYNTPAAFAKPKQTAKKNNRLAKVTGGTVVDNLEEELKREESSPKAKVGRGVSNIQKQLSEIEKFVNWYSKIKTENGLKKEDYWKRTNASLYKIRERLMGITEKLRTL